MKNSQLTATLVQGLNKDVIKSGEFTPFGKIVAEDATNPQSDSSLKIWPTGTKKEIHDSWQEMASIDRHAEFGNAWGRWLTIFKNTCMTWPQRRLICTTSINLTRDRCGNVLDT